MPFKSKKQWKWMFWAEKQGTLKKGTARKWAKHTKTSFKKLPSRKRKKRRR
jgi:hypothetical protein